MICTYNNMVALLVDNDYTEVEAKDTLTRYYDIFLEYTEEGYTAEECLKTIVAKHMEDIDSEPVDSEEVPDDQS